MASIRTWDYYCKHCETTHKDVIYTKTCPKTIKCSCGKRAEWAFIRKNQIHPTLSGRKYGMFDPQLGVVVEDYAHKKQLLRQYGKEELPPETHDKIAEDIYEQEQRAQSVSSSREPDGLERADSLDELHKKMTKNVDVSHTGERQLNRLEQGELIEGPWGIEPSK